MDIQNQINTIKHILPNAKIIEALFKGHNDYGQMDDLNINGISIDEGDPGYEEISPILDYIINNQVDWDWQSEKGGVVNIVIDLVNNTVEVSGYYNIIMNAEPREIDLKTALL